MISQEDPYVYGKKFSDHIVYVVLYVNDMLLVGNNMDMIKEVKPQLSSKFNMKDIRASNFNFGMEKNTLDPTVMFLDLNSSLNVIWYFRSLIMLGCHGFVVDLKLKPD